MDYNASVLLINHAKDVEIEYNIKILILLIMFIYALGSFWLASKWNVDKFYCKFVRKFLLQIPFGIFLFFFPLFSIFLLRGISYESLYMLMMSFYGYSLVILLIAGKLGIFEFAGQLLGLKYTPKQMKTNFKY